MPYGKRQRRGHVSVRSPDTAGRALTRGKRMSIAGWKHSEERELLSGTMRSGARLGAKDRGGDPESVCE